MRTLGEITDLVTTKLNKTDPASVLACQKFCRQRANYIYDLCLWRDSLWVSTFTVQIGQQIVIFPKHTELVITLIYNDSAILPSNKEVLFMSNPTIFSDNADPITYSELRPVGVEVQPASEKMNFVSNNAADTGIVVKIRGELAGVPQSEKITMQGTTPVQTSKVYDTVYALGKSMAVTAQGDFTVTGAMSGTKLVIFTAEAMTVSCPCLELDPIPNEVQPVMVLFKRKPTQMIDDSDCPPLTHMEDALISFTMGDMLQRRRQYAKAQDMFMEAGGMVEKMKAVHEYQKANLPAFTPTPLFQGVDNYSRRRGYRLGGIYAKPL